MNKRLEQFLGAENITQSSFADSIGVARASVSHILAGRNKPGFDFIENMSKRYPTLNLEWLITGKGKMYKEINVSEPVDFISESLFTQSEDSPSVTNDTAAEKVKAPVRIEEKISENSLEVKLSDVIAEPAPISQPPLKTVDLNGKSIAKIIVFYTDNSFVEIK